MSQGSCQMHQMKYNNISILPTGGQRTVEVQFTTQSGAMSNIATAFIEVIQLPLVPVELGDDLEICEGQTATFNAGNPGASYLWSTDQTSQSISVGSSGIYSVTVSNGTHCPGEDEVYLEVIPVIHVSIGGDTEVCDNENATISIITDSNIPVNVEINSSTGGPLTFSNVSGNFTFTDLLSDDTEYTIVNVTPSQAACIEITDPVHVIDVYQSYVHSFEANICDGDSIWLGFYWETNHGVYENTFNTFEGCDSVVTTTVTVSPAIHISAQSTTCDSAAAGVHIQYLNNPAGCDTVLTTTVSLLASDTTLIHLTDCNAADTGLFQQVLTNIVGCDSMVITDVAYTGSYYNIDG